MTILSSGTPAYELISITEVEGQPDPELVTRLWGVSSEVCQGLTVQSVYTLSPWL